MVFKNKSNPILIFIGTSGSGKTTLSTKLAEEFKLKRSDIFSYVKPYIDKYGSTTVRGNLLQKAYDDLISDLPLLSFDTLEIASDRPGNNILKIIKTINKKTILIFCRASLRSCLQRNALRELPVPEEILKRQTRFGSSYYKKLAKKLNITLVIINTEENFKKSYLKLKAVL